MARRAPLPAEPRSWRPRLTTPSGKPALWPFLLGGLAPGCVLAIFHAPAFVGLIGVAFGVIGFVALLVVATVRWATSGMVDVSTVETGDYAEARLEGFLRAFDHVKPSWEDPSHPVYRELNPAVLRGPVSEADRDILLHDMIERRAAKARVDRYNRPNPFARSGGFVEDGLPIERG